MNCDNVGKHLLHYYYVTFLKQKSDLIMHSVPRDNKYFRQSIIGRSICRYIINYASNLRCIGSPLVAKYLHIWP